MENGIVQLTSAARNRGGYFQLHNIGAKGFSDMRDIRVIQVGQLLKKHSQAYTLYDADGLCPTLSSGQKRYGGLPTWIIIYDTESITDRKHC